MLVADRITTNMNDGVCILDPLLCVINICFRYDTLKQKTWRSPVWVKPADHIHRQLEECFYSKYCCNKWLFSQKTAKHVHQTAHFILNLKIFSLRSHGTKKGKRNRHNWEAGTIKRSRFVPKKLPELKNQTENHQVGRNCVDLLAECANTLALTTSWGVFSACCWVLTSENQWVQLWFVLSLSAF